MAGNVYIYDRQNDKFFLGSDHFAAEYRRARSDKKYKAAILLDLFAGKGATFPVDRTSTIIRSERGGFMGARGGNGAGFASMLAPTQQDFASCRK